MILFDARMVGHSGIGTYIRGLLEGFSEETRRRMVFAGPENILRRWNVETRPAPEKIYGLGEQVSWPGRLRALRPELLHVPHYNIPLLYQGPLVVTVHDLIHLLFPQYSRRWGALAYARFFMSQVAKRARAVLADSVRTQEDLIDFGVPAGRITVAYAAVSPRYQPLPPETVQPVLDIYGLQPGYLLYVGNIRALKNVQRLLSAYALLKTRRSGLPPLVLAGRDQMPAQTAPFRQDPAFRFLGEVPEAHLPSLYSGAGLFVFPSLYEGFGLPPLEAMACGAPVVASRGGSLPEVLGQAAVLVDPMDEEAMGHAIEKVLDDGSLRRALSSAGRARAQVFSWRKTAAVVEKVYAEALA